MLPAQRNGRSHLPPTSSPVNRLFDQFFRGQDWLASSAARGWTGMPVSMWEDDDYIYVEADAPGVTENDVDVSIHGDELAICFERKRELQTGGYDTRSYGRFEQRISLPSTAASDQAEAKLANGVLSLKFAKRDEAKPRKIAVSAG